MGQTEELLAVADHDECVVFAGEYAQMVHDWFEESREVFVEKGEEIASKERAGLAGVDPEGEVLALTDAVDVIQWYRFFVQVKLTRAKSGLLLGEDEDLEECTRATVTDLRKPLSLPSIGLSQRGT